MKQIFQNVLLFTLVFIAKPVFAQQNGLIIGTVADMNTGKSIAGATLNIVDLPISVQSDSSGRFSITLPVGTYKLSVSNIGYVSQIKYNIVVGSGNPQLVNFELEAQLNKLAEVQVKFMKGKSAVAADMVTPLSVQQLTSEEIKSSPGGNLMFLK